MFDAATRAAVEKIAASTKTETAAWLAIAEVESAGRVRPSTDSASR